MRPVHATAALLCLCGLAADRASAEDLLLTDVRIVDPAAERVSRGSVAIREGRIAEVLREVPESFAGTVVDGEGQWLIPGLHDMHTHSYGNMAPGAEGPLRDRFGTEGTARRMLYLGITGFLDLFGPEQQLFAVRERQREGEVPGADLYLAGPCFTATGGHCTEYGVPTRVIDTPEDARIELADLAPHRPDVVKLIYDHAPGRRPTVSRETMEALLAAAREHGLPTVVHIGTWQDAAEALDAGASCLTHLARNASAEPAVIPDRLVAQMRESDVCIIPTLAVRLDPLSFSKRPSLLDDPLLHAVASRESIEAHRLENRPAWIRPILEGRGAELASYQWSLRKLAAGGVSIVAGTDSGNIGTFQGYSLHRELELMVEAGLTPWQALHAATIAPARLLGKRLGVQPGDDASLVLLADSPLDEIRNTRAIAAVIHHGRIIDRQALLGDAPLRD